MLTAGAADSFTTSCTCRGPNDLARPAGKAAEAGWGRRAAGVRSRSSPASSSPETPSEEGDEMTDDELEAELNRRRAAILERKVKPVPFQRG